MEVWNLCFISHSILSSVTLGEVLAFSPLSLSLYISPSMYVSISVSPHTLSSLAVLGLITVILRGILVSSYHSYRPSAAAPFALISSAPTPVIVIVIVHPRDALSRPPPPSGHSHAVIYFRTCRFKFTIFASINWAGRKGQSLKLKPIQGVGGHLARQCGRGWHAKRTLVPHHVSRRSSVRLYPLVAPARG